MATKRKRSAKAETVKAAAAGLELPDFMPYRLDVLNGDLGRLLGQVYANGQDIGEHEWRVLVVLSNEQPLAANEVGERASMDKVQVSRAVARLVSSGLVIRHQDKIDRRRSSLRLSAKGSRLLGKLVPAAQAREAAVLEALSERERTQFDRLLRKLHARAVELMD